MRLNKIPSVLSFTSYDHNWPVFGSCYSEETVKMGTAAKQVWMGAQSALAHFCKGLGSAKLPKNAVGLFTDWRHEAMLSKNYLRIKRIRKTWRKTMHLGFVSCGKKA